MKASDKDWFRPLWRRIALLVGLIGWFGWEVWAGYLSRPEQPDYMWIIIVGMALVYCVYTLFLTFDRDDGAPGDGTPPSAS